MSSQAESYALPERVVPVAEEGGLDAPYWDGLRAERLLVQKCDTCGTWQWGPEWLCSQCHTFSLSWVEVPSEDGEYKGVLYSWERIFHPTDERLAASVPYVVAMVSIPAAEDIRMTGNLLGDQTREIEIGVPLRAVFEHHGKFTLVQWATY